MEEEDACALFLDTLHQLVLHSYEERDMVTQPRAALPFLQPGRLVEVACRWDESGETGAAAQVARIVSERGAGPSAAQGLRGAAVREERVWGVVVNFELLGNGAGAPGKKRKRGGEGEGAGGGDGEEGDGAEQVSVVVCVVGCGCMCVWVQWGGNQASSLSTPNDSTCACAGRWTRETRPTMWWTCWSCAGQTPWGSTRGTRAVPRVRPSPWMPAAVTGCPSSRPCGCPAWADSALSASTSPRTSERR